MNSGRETSPTQPPVGSSTTSGPSSQSNRSSPLAPASGADSASMATTAFPSSSHAFRPAANDQIPRQFAANGRGNAVARDFTMPVGTPFSSSPAPSSIRVLLRRLPLSSSEQSIRLMLVWSQELLGIELLSPEKSEDDGFRSALLRFKTMNGATEAKNMLDGRSNISKDAEMIVEILNTAGAQAAGVNGRRYDGSQPGLNGYIPTSAAPGGPSARQQSQFAASFPTRDRPTPAGVFPGHEFVPGESGFHSIFSSQSPIGNHLNVSDRNHVSSKSLITGDYNDDDDDDTSNILRDPVAYAENNAPQDNPFGRRATAPQFPVNQMANLALNTNNSPGPQSLPRVLNPVSPINNVSIGSDVPVSNVPVNNVPVNNAPINNVAANNGTAGNFNPPPGRHFQLHPNFPAVNPADQNPPCNTLYVGNLPIDTSEEELKAMFSKQRGYKRLCFRTKQNGPMCFVEFENISFATKALHELYGQPLHNSTKGGIRLSFSKNPLGVRSGQVPAQSQSMHSPHANGIANGPANGFSASGPPPGLAAPPGLGNGRSNYTNGNSNGVIGNQRQQHAYHAYPPMANNSPWNTPSFPNGAVNGHANNQPINGHVSNGPGPNNGYAFNGPSSNPYAPRHHMNR